MAWFLALVVVVLFLAWKALFKLSINWDKSPTCLVGKTTIVTGANTGMGFVTATEFAKRGARVILACRNTARAEEARKKIVTATGNPNVVVKIVDFASLASVRKFAKEINADEERLDILVNNAGAIIFGDVATEDGNNVLMQINHLGPFLMTLLLIDLLKKSAPSRIVNMTSGASHAASLDPNKLNVYQGKIMSYSNTKLCNLLFANELTRRLKGSGVLANSVHPGVVRTEIFRTVPVLPRTIIHGIINLFLQTPVEGAQTAIYAALSPDVQGVSGEYFVNCGIPWYPQMPKKGRDEDLARKIWEKSEELVKLTDKERRL